jgi:alkyldihydroxyacetonephosphate synthase
LKAALAPFADEVLGHFSHVYPHGTSLYIILLGRVADDALAEQMLLQIWDSAMTICVKNGAVISHHHGSGLARQPYVHEALGSSHVVLQRIKDALDPAGIMNPGKLGLE